MCRNPAAAGTDPPACARHRSAPPRQLPLPFPSDGADVPAAAGQTAKPVAGQPAAGGHFYFPAPSIEERLALEASGLEPNLRAEVALARVLLRRLVLYLDESASALPPEEMRRLAGLIFSGTRTVAQLLAQPARGPEETEDWVLDALAALGRW
jgi:hypothetical protein